MKVLLVLGAVGAIVGGIIAILSNNALADAVHSASYDVALAGFTGGGNAIAQAQLGLVIGWGLVIVGVLLLVAALIVRAMRAPAVTR